MTQPPWKKLNFPVVKVNSPLPFPHIQMAGIFYALEQYIGGDHMRELCEKYLAANPSKTTTHSKTAYPPFDITAAAQQGIAYARYDSQPKTTPTCPGSPPPSKSEAPGSLPPSKSEAPGAPVKDKTNATIFDTTPITYERF